MLHQSVALLLAEHAVGASVPDSRNNNPVKEGTLLFNAQSSVFDMSETVPVIVQCACAMLNAMLLSWAFDRLLHTEDILAHDIKATAALIEELDEMIAEKEHGSAESKSAKPGKEDPRC